MALTVQFYRNKSENIKADKELTHVIDETLVFHDNVDILRPSVIINKKINTNYAYISDFGRYYFVKITALTGGLFQYDFNVDYAKTYANEIRQTTCTVLRNENISNAYLFDTEYRTLAYKNYITKEFPNGLNNDCIILNVLGGGTNG